MSREGDRARRTPPDRADDCAPFQPSPSPFRVPPKIICRCRPARGASARAPAPTPPLHSATPPPGQGTFLFALPSVLSHSVDRFYLRRRTAPCFFHQFHESRRRAANQLRLARRERFLQY